MSAPRSILKKPKLEHQNGDANDESAENKTTSIATHRGGGGEGGGDDDVNSRDEQEEALVALIEHRQREVQHHTQRVSYYQSLLAEAEKKLAESKAQLGRLRGHGNAVSSKSSVENGAKVVKAEGRSASPIQANEGSSRNQLQPRRTELVVPAMNDKVSQSTRSTGSGARHTGGSSAQSSPSTQSNSVARVKEEKPWRSTPNAEVVEVQDRVKRKLEEKEHKELIPLVSKSSYPHTVNCYASNHISSQHKRKMRSLALCPLNDQLFVTSALDGMVNLWQLQSRGSSASLLSSTDCASSKHRHWPEDVAWHPQGNSLFCTYTADGGDSQISVLNFNKAQRGSRVTFLDDKPHLKGIINSIMFMPWEDTCFVTGGSDHAAVIWKEKDQENSWKPKALHRNQHSSAVMGLAGMYHKQIVLTAGADKRIIGFDVQGGRADYKHQLDSKCMSVLPNPCDFNLFMVQTGTPEKQLRLFDIRLRQTEIHTFGFKQESSDSQSALINQAWSPDGLYLSSGSVDPIIHIFDIRYKAHKPSQSVRAHQKRVFKAEWHYTFPLLISISSDLHIGLHKTS
ncbi:hypothetical protein Tsubulata_017428 [Turnera subulata]|uniref:Uncharacterized protein n=1 Tax=Turnera subulata TaxID=218843 RepID=A0A9Q0FV34_9ROSI|nr:hypothetical protein Tsubulata_017428 [Turnera subulata]